MSGRRSRRTTPRHFMPRHVTTCRPSAARRTPVPRCRRRSIARGRRRHSSFTSSLILPSLSLSLSLSLLFSLSRSLARSLARSFSLALAISLRSLTPRYRGCRDPDSPIYYRSTATKNAKVRKAQRQWRFLLEKAAEKEAADPTFRGCYFTEGRGEPAPPPSVANARENAPLRGPSAATSRRSCARHCRWKAATCSWFCERSVA